MHTVEHQSLIHKLIHGRMNKIYVFQAFLSFVKSLLGIFVPVYLYSLGYSLELVILTLVGNSIVYFLFLPFAMKILNRIGFKKMLLLSMLFYIVHILILNQLSTMNMLYFHLTWITYGIYFTLFWPTMHAEVSINSDHKKSGSQIGNLLIVVLTISALAPIIGGYFLEFLDFSELIILNLVLLIIGSLPLLFSEDIKLKKFNFSYVNSFKLTFLPKFRNSSKAFLAEGGEIMLAVGIWPLILYILLNENFLNLGFLFSIVSIMSIIILYFFKTYLDKHSKNNILYFLSKIKSFNWILRFSLLFFLGFFIYIIESMTKVFNSLFETTYFSIFYSNSKITNTMDYILFRDNLIHVMRIIIGSFLALISYLFESLMVLVIISVVLGFIFPYFLSKIDLFKLKE